MSTLAPRLRHRITFQEQLNYRDSDGIEQTTWQNVWLDTETQLDDWPAEVLTGPGKEFIASGAVQAETAARITCRWFPGIKATWRILWDGLTYNIGTWDTDRTSRREYRIRCTAGVNDGQ